MPYIHGPAFFNSDLAVFKVFKINERQNVEFRFSGFNFLNHPLESFQNNGDIQVKLHNTSVCTAFQTPIAACTGNSGGNNFDNGYAYANTFTNVSQANLSGNFVLSGRNVTPGYASTKYGRRVLEMSAKWSF